ncbi:MAG: cysteine peptidase family C39 domain-containing protein [Bryobacteraceae bacterium]
MTVAVFALLLALDVPFFVQEKNGCGAASVAMVMHYWRVPQPPSLVYQQLYNTDIGGIPLEAMREFLEKAGLQAFTLRGERADLERHLALGRPVIVGLRSKPRAPLHFVVVAGFENEHVHVNDPTRKKAQRVRAARFEKQWASADRWMLLAARRE